jgi:hypothetical protein
MIPPPTPVFRRIRRLREIASAERLSAKLARESRWSMESALAESRRATRQAIEMVERRDATIVELRAQIRRLESGRP